MLIAGFVCFFGYLILNIAATVGGSVKAYLISAAFGIVGYIIYKLGLRLWFKD